MDYNLTLFKDSVKDILLTPLSSTLGNMNINNTNSTSVNNNSDGANMMNSSAIISPDNNSSQ